MEQQGQWSNIDEIVSAYLDESEQSYHKFFKCKQLAIRARRELGLDAFAFIKTVKQPINDNFTVNLPKDCWKYTKIGVFNAVGEVVTFKQNDSLTLFQDNLPTRVGSVDDNSIFPNPFGVGNPYYWNYWYDGCGYALYGLPSGAPYTPGYSVDEKNNIVVLPSNYPFDYLIIEYIGLDNENNDYLVPLQFYEAVIAYIRWKDILSMPTSTHVNNAAIQMRRHEYYNERRLAIARYKPLYLQDAYTWSQENMRLVPKS